RRLERARQYNRPLWQRGEHDPQPHEPADPRRRRHRHGPQARHPLAKTQHADVKPLPEHPSLNGHRTTLVLRQHRCAERVDFHEGLNDRELVDAQMPQSTLRQMMTAIASIALSLAALVWFADRPKIITDTLIAAAYVGIALRCLFLAARARTRAHSTSSSYEASAEPVAPAPSSRQND